MKRCVYGETGRAVNEITSFLRTIGLNAVPNHSMGVEDASIIAG
ncbi:MAG: hypothetical protein ACERKD_20160 [Prolixibacteraceae bacterium]